MTLSYAKLDLDGVLEFHKGVPSSLNVDLGNVLICQFPPLFKKYPKMWAYALGLPFEGNSRVQLIFFEQEDHNFEVYVKAMAEGMQAEISYDARAAWSAPAGFNRAYIRGVSSFQ